MCHDCGWIATCSRCDARYTYHQQLDELLCHHCCGQHKLFQKCPNCKGSELILLGVGTERIEKLLAQHFPDVPAIRIDRDSTRRKGTMEKLLKSVYNGQSRILVGTQMLAKGHHFPDVTMVAIIDVDSSLYSADFRAPERLGQTIIQVAGRAGRAEKPGEVYIQTHHPDHPLLLQLVAKGYGKFAEHLLRERKSAALPPYSYMALLRAEATHLEMPQQFLRAVKQLLGSSKNDVEILGPIPALMERKAGKYRAQLMLQTKKRSFLQKVLPELLEQIERLPLRRNVRWSLDVDPVDLF
jgi:primosomal protein N' (replication factor Y)